MIVDIDEAQLDAEFDARLARMPEEGLEGEVLTPSDRECERLLRKFKVADRLHHHFAPAWEIDQEDKDGLTSATGEILESFFPGGVQGIDSWGPYAKLAFFALCIVASNFDDENMCMRPTHPPEDPAAEPAGDPPAGDPPTADLAGGQPFKAGEPDASNP